MPEQTDTHTAERLVLVDRALWVDRGDGNLDGLTGPLPPWADDWAAGIVEAVNERVDLLAELDTARARVAELEHRDEVLQRVLNEERARHTTTKHLRDSDRAHITELRARVAELEAQLPRIERRLGNVDALPPGSQIIDDDGTPALKVADLPLGATDGDGYRSEWVTDGGIVGTYDFAMPVTVLREPIEEGQADA